MVSLWACASATRRRFSSSSTPICPRDLENDVVVNETRVKVDETSDKRKNMTEKVPVLVEPPDKCPMGGLHPDIELLVRNMKSGSPVRVSRSAPKDYAGK